MRAARAFALALAFAACSGQPADRPAAADRSTAARGDDAATIEQGRTYTQWLFGGELDKLWARFTPEMQRTFATPRDLAAFAARTSEDLGNETGTPSENATTAGGMRVYSRTVQFARSPRPVEVQWTLAADGGVTGMFVRPTPVDSTPSKAAQ
ncbi:MAG: hypothetical protein H0U85_01030 [Gemmatimonadales bacterium]|nr:hypothetical protein [Gemmatimonadales bacterium]